jgi:hypothetical protein
LVGDELILTMANGTVHSRIPVDDTMDPVEALERISSDTMPVRLLWNLDELDEALARDGWSGTGVTARNATCSASTDPHELIAHSI